VSTPEIDRYAPRTPLGHVKDAVLRAKLHVENTLDRAMALHVEPHRHRAVIRALNFELAGACNLRCKWCSLDSRLRPGFMEPALFERVLDDIADRELYDVRVINLHHSGDILLHPRFREILEIVDRKKAERDDFPSVQALTSATHLKGDRVDALLETDAVDWLRFSVDGGNARDFEAIRVGARWDQVVGNIHAFLDEAERRGRSLRTGIISVFETSEPAISPEFRDLVARVTNYMPRLPHDWVGKTELGLPKPSQTPQGLCRFVLAQTVVLHDGRVTLCCNDLNAEGVIGDLAESSLYEIFRGPERRRVIEAMRADRRRDLPFCGTCSQE
jgi:sulfatase maturation enzyme AslB (radical SAM superfamily)